MLPLMSLENLVFLSLAFFVLCRGRPGAFQVCYLISFSGLILFRHNLIGYFFN